GLGHGHPAAVGAEPPLQHPLRLALLLRDEADDILVQALGGLDDLDGRLEAVLVLVDIDTPHLVDGLLYSGHEFRLSRSELALLCLSGHRAAARCNMRPRLYESPHVP